MSLNHCFALKSTNIPCVSEERACEAPVANIGDFVKYTKTFEKNIIVSAEIIAYSSLIRKSLKKNTMLFFQQTDPKADPKCNTNDRVCVTMEGNPNQNSMICLQLRYITALS